MSKITLYFKRFLGLFPQPLPVGVTAFDAYVANITATYALPTQDADSIKFAIASRILGFGSMKCWASPYSFVVNVNAACAKQIAGNAFQQIKANQKARELAAAEALKKAEVTATPTVTNASST